MTRTLAVTVAALISAMFVTDAQARSRHQYQSQSNVDAGYAVPDDWNRLDPKMLNQQYWPDVNKTAKRYRAKDGRSYNIRGKKRTAAHPHRSRIADLTPALARKVNEIVADCGSRVISGYRPGARIAGTGHASLHSRYPSEAADLAGNPSCIYRHLHGWPGGYSVDYGRMKHVHISLAHDRRERGARFNHYGGHRYAAHHRHRVVER